MDNKKILTQDNDQVNLLTNIGRWTRDGQPDPSFTTTSLPLFIVSDAKEQNDGKILLSDRFGVETLGTTSSLTVHRLKRNGTVDTSFGNNGVATLPSATEDNAYAMLIQRQGKIVVLGNREQVDQSRTMLLTRFTKDGQVDQSFGVNGEVLLPFNVVGASGSFAPISIDETKDKKMVVYGTVVIGNGRWAFGVARFDEDGSLDTTYGNQGTVIFDPLP